MSLDGTKDQYITNLNLTQIVNHKPLWKLLLDSKLICESMIYKIIPEDRQSLTNQPFNFLFLKIHRLYFKRIVKTILMSDCEEFRLHYCEICQEHDVGQHLVSIEHFNFLKCKCGCSFNNKHEISLLSSHLHANGIVICEICLMRVVGEQQYKHEIMHNFINSYYK